MFLYDATLRIPWIMAGPGIPPGKRVKDQARTIDLLPTLVNLLEGEIPSECQGTSLLPALAGQEVKTDFAYAESLMPKIDMGWAELRAMRTAKWKYVRAPRAELYDLEKDPHELVNVIQSIMARTLKSSNLNLEFSHRQVPASQKRFDQSRLLLKLNDSYDLSGTSQRVHPVVSFSQDRARTQKIEPISCNSWTKRSPVRRKPRLHNGFDCWNELLKKTQTTARSILSSARAMT